MNSSPRADAASDEQRPRLLLVSDDLMVASRVEGTARRCGWSATAVSPRQIGAEAVARAQLLAVDLTGPLDEDALRRLVESCGGTTIAFGPHVHVDRLAAARSAGFGVVSPRGAFFDRLGALLAEGASDQEA